MCTQIAHRICICTRQGGYCLFPVKMLFSVLALLAGRAFAAPSPSSIKVSLASAQAFASTSDLTYKLTVVDAPVSGTGSPGGTSQWSLSIDDTTAGYKQTINGFGGSITDATVTVINALPSDQRSQLLRELLTSDGANFSLLRHTIAASDLSGPPAYTYDDSNNSADPNLDNFNLGDRGEAMAKLLTEMKGVRSDITIFGSPWSVPGWMKLNGVSLYPLGTIESCSLASRRFSLATPPITGSTRNTTANMRSTS